MISQEIHEYYIYNYIYINFAKKRCNQQSKNKILSKSFFLIIRCKYEKYKQNNDLSILANYIQLLNY